MNQYLKNSRPDKLSGAINVISSPQFILSKALKFFFIPLIVLMFLNIGVTQPGCSSLGCSAPYNRVFYNNTSTSSIGVSSFTDELIYVDGAFTINTNAVFNCCSFIFAGGAQITIATNYNLQMTDCSVNCSSWGGIVGDGNNRVQVYGSYFEDFTTCFELTNPSSFVFKDNDFISGTSNAIALDLYNVNSTGTGIWVIAGNYFQCGNGIGMYLTNCYSIGIGYYSYDHNVFDGCNIGM